MNLLEQTQARLADVARLGEIADDFVTQLSGTRRTVKSTLSLDMDDGSIETFDAWHSRHVEHWPLANGPMVFRSGVTMEEVEGLAMLGTLKAALLDLPFDGGAGGVRIGAAGLSEDERTRLARRFSERLFHWSRRSRARARAQAGLAVLRALSPSLGLPKVASIAIIGLGEVGGEAAAALTGMGHVVVAASDSSASVRSDVGIPVAKLLAAKTAGLIGALSGRRGIARAGSEAALEADCQVMILAGPPSVINEANARNVRAQVVLELSDGSVAAEADGILEDRGVVVVPDLLSASGPLAEQHLERQLDGGLGDWTTEQCDDWIAARTCMAAREAWRIAEDMKVSLREAAYHLAVEQLAVVHRDDLGS